MLSVDLTREEAEQLCDRAARSPKINRAIRRRAEAKLRAALASDSQGGESGSETTGAPGLAGLGPEEREVLRRFVASGLPDGYQLNHITARQFLERIGEWVQEEHCHEILDVGPLHGEPRFRTECSCGWHGSARYSKQSCKWDHGPHLTEVARIREGYEAGLVAADQSKQAALKGGDDE